MKKILAVILCLAAALTLTACGSFEYSFDKSTLTKYTGKGGDVVIPKGITVIGKEAFYQCDTLTGVVIPNGVTTIYANAFAECPNLKTVTIPDSVTTLSFSVFYSCTALERIDLPSGMTEISGGVFANCTSLSEITIPQSVTKFSATAFVNTPWLENKRKEDPLVIVNNVLVDGQTCSGSVLIPNGVTAIDELAFSDCNNIEVTVPDSVSRIAFGAFCRCYNLNIILPDSLTQVDPDAFEFCDNISVTYKGITYSENQLDKFFRATKSS